MPESPPNTLCHTVYADRVTLRRPPGPPDIDYTIDRLEAWLAEQAPGGDSRQGGSKRGACKSLNLFHFHPQTHMPESPTLNLPEILALHAQCLADPITGQRANLDGANLRGADLDGANLTGANLTRADLRGADLDGANLDGANLTSANLDGANLTRANLTGANLTRANLGRANLDGANLTGANLTRANLGRANLDGANLGRANLDGANLGRANLTRADLTSANLRGADLDGANLRGADLDGANLTGANLTRANLIGARGIAIAADAPQRLRAAATAALQEGALEMRTWHACETTHCLGGWLIHQAGELGRLLEAAVGPNVAGLVLGGVEAHSHFYDSNEAAAEWLRSVLAQPEVKP